MQARVDWVLIIFGTQVIKKKRPVWPMFPGSLSVSYDYGLSEHFQGRASGKFTLTLSTIEHI